MGVLSILAGLQEVALRTLQELANTTTACSNAMNALDAAKADKLVLHPITIPAAEWQKDTQSYYIDLSVPGLTADDCVGVLIEPSSADVAKKAVVENGAESCTGTLRLRARKQPTADLSAHYYFVREDILMALGPVSMGGSSYVLPPATADTLGGVMVGNGLKIDEKGNLSVENSSNPLDAYPVGSVYQTTGSTSPASLFGGTWEEIASERVLMGASSSHAAGSTVDAGLPNITGTARRHSSGGLLLYNTDTTTGCFYARDKLASNMQALGQDGYVLGFDASRSSAVYGKSDTVQPAAYYVHIWRRTA